LVGLMSLTFCLRAVSSGLDPYYLVAKLRKLSGLLIKSIFHSLLISAMLR